MSGAPPGPGASPLPEGCSPTHSAWGPPPHTHQAVSLGHRKSCCQLTGVLGAASCHPAVHAHTWILSEALSRVKQPPARVGGGPKGAHLPEPAYEWHQGGGNRRAGDAIRWAVCVASPLRRGGAGRSEGCKREVWAAVWTTRGCRLPSVCQELDERAVGRHTPTARLPRKGWAPRPPPNTRSTDDIFL